MGNTRKLCAEQAGAHLSFCRAPGRTHAGVATSRKSQENRARCRGGARVRASLVDSLIPSPRLSSRKEQMVHEARADSRPTGWFNRSRRVAVTEMHPLRPLRSSGKFLSCRWRRVVQLPLRPLRSHHDPTCITSFKRSQPDPPLRGPGRGSSCAPHGVGRVGVCVVSRCWHCGIRIAAVSRRRPQTSRTDCSRRLHCARAARAGKTFSDSFSNGCTGRICAHAARRTGGGHFRPGCACGSAGRVAASRSCCTTGGRRCAEVHAIQSHNGNQHPAAANLSRHRPATRSSGNGARPFHGGPVG